MSESPIQLPVSRAVRGGGILKIKRGGTGKISNSGNEKRRFANSSRQLRDVKTGKQIPWPARGAAIWNPLDPFIIAYRQTHAVTPPKWRRTNPGV